MICVKPSVADAFDLCQRATQRLQAKLCAKNGGSHAPNDLAIAAGVAVSAAAAAPSRAQSACPAGYRFLAPASCVLTRTPGCPRGYHLNPTKTLCLNDTGRGAPTHAVSCPQGYTLRANLGCTITRAASCPAGKQVHPRTGACVTGVVR